MPTSQTSSDAFTFSHIRAIKPKVLSKRFSLGMDGGLVKEAGGVLTEGIVKIQKFVFVEQFADLLKELGPEDALVYGICGYEEAFVVTKHNIGKPNTGDLPIVARSADHFKFPPGPGVLMLDYDAPDGEPPLSPEKFRDTICKACPDIKNAPLVLAHSASSHIWHGHHELIGQRGLRCYVIVKDAADIPRAGATLAKRLWLNGHGRIKIGGAGQMLVRCPVDTAVWGAEKLDFAGGAAVAKPLEQRRPAPLVVNDWEHDPLDTRNSLPDLSAEEDAKYSELVAKAKEFAKPESEKIRHEFMDKRAEELLGKNPELSREAAIGLVAKAVDGGQLPPDWNIVLSDGKKVTVGDILADPSAFHEKACRDPLEPSYGSSQVAMIFTDKSPLISSFAHGGRKFRLLSAEAAFASIEGEPSDGNVADCLESKIEELNREFAVATIGSKVVVVQETEKEIVPLRRQDFVTLLANRIEYTINAKGNIKAVPLSKLWLESPARRDATGIVFKPDGCAQREINLWRGLAINPAELDLEQAAAGCRLYRAHVENVVCRGSAEHIKYVWAWLADLVKNPGGAKPGVALVLRGGRGVGKGFFARPFLQIFGRHGLQVTHRDHLTGRFNHHLSDKIFVFLDEAFWAGEKKHEGVLKGLLTEPRFAVERKGIDVYEVDSYVRVVMASNEDWVVPAGPDERRFLVLDVAETHKQDSSGYFKALARELDHGGVGSLLTWLLLRSGEGVDLRRAPASSAGLDQKLESLEAAYAWWLHCLQIGRVYNNLIDSDPWPANIVPELALDSFETWARTWPGKVHMTIRKLAKKIYGPYGVCPGKRTTAKIDGGVKNCYSLLGLEEARMKFEKFLGATSGLEWENQGEYDDL
jgi:hypothetical protein